MVIERTRRRGFLAGAAAALTSLAGCGDAKDGSTAEGPRGGTTAQSTGTGAPSVPPHDHAGPDTGGGALAPECITVTELEQSASFVVYEREGRVRALDAETQRERFSDGDARTVIQSAIDELAPGGVVYLKSGTYRVGPESIKPRTGTSIVGEGMGATTLKVKDGLDEDADGFYVIHVDRGVERASIANLEIDGNESNNRDVPPYPDSPHSHGISIEGGPASMPADEKPARVSVRNVYVHDTIRSNVVVTGRHCELENLWLANSATDHWLYVAGGENCELRGVHASGFARASGVVFGVGERPARHNVLSGLVVEDATTTPYQNDEPDGLAGRYPVAAVVLRRSSGNAHHNALRDVRIHPSSTGDGHSLDVFQPDTSIQRVSYRGGVPAGGVVEVRPSAVGTTVRDATFDVRSDGDWPVCRSRSADVTFENVRITADRSGSVRGFDLNGTARAVDRNTIRDARVETGGAALGAFGRDNGVRDLFVQNFHDLADAGVVTAGAVEFVRRGVY